MHDMPERAPQFSLTRDDIILAIGQLPT
jgi:hypothetical protein